MLIDYDLVVYEKRQGFTFAFYEGSRACIKGDDKEGVLDLLKSIVAIRDHRKKKLNKGVII